MDFATALRAEIVTRKASVRARRLLRIIDGPKNARRRRVLERMERHTRAEIGAGGTGKIDWSKIDWEKLFEQILKLLMAILPLFI